MRNSGHNGFYLEILRAYVDSADDAIFVLCDELKFLFCNRVMEQWLGESESDLIRHKQRVPITACFRDSAGAERFLSHFVQALHEGPSRFECFLDPPRGTSRWVEFSLNKVDLEAGQIVIGVARDITSTQQDRINLLKLSSAIEQTADSVVITDKRGVIEYVNPAFERTTGYSRQEALGQTPRLVKSGWHDGAFYERLWRTILRGEAFRSVIANRKKDGSLYYEEKTITPLRDTDGRITHFVSTGKDVTERMKDQERLDYLAYYDALTGLPNRNLFHDRLGNALGHAWHRKGQTAILLLNLDNFNSINNSLGHDVGDQLLKAVATRLGTSADDEDTVARMGNDEFAVLLEHADEADDVARVARKLIDDLSKPFRLGEHEIFVSTSVGIAISPGDGNDADSLWKNADVAMHRAKERGHNLYQFYSADMTTRARDGLTLRTQLGRALERGEFRLHYQPIVEIDSGRIASVEALIRWQHPDRGLVVPDEFMPALEESGMIIRAGDWVLRAVCEQIQQWQKLTRQHIRVAVNISGRQFTDPGFLDKVGCMHCILRGQGLCAGIAEFEITESVFMSNEPTTIATLKAFRESGVRLAIDDFGTGYSSLVYLIRFRVDTVKIDRIFVRDMVSNADAAVLVEAIIAMAHALNLTVVAEGVETARQLEMLRGLGCDLMQGYLFSRPLPADEMTEMLKREDSR